jgi:hypothetical protein
LSIIALATVTRMRATNADIWAIIERTRRVLEGGREAMLEAGAVVLVTLSVFLRRVRMPWKESSVMNACDLSPVSP